MMFGIYRVAPERKWAFWASFTVKVQTLWCLREMVEDNLALFHSILYGSHNYLWLYNIYEVHKIRFLGLLENIFKKKPKKKQQTNKQIKRKKKCLELIFR